MNRLSRFRLSELNIILIFMVINFVTLGIVIAIINYNFQLAQDQRVQTLALTKAIHDSDQVTSNKTDSLINTHIHQDKEIHDRQTAIIKNQEKIINSTNATDADLRMIRHASDQVDSIVAKQNNNSKILFNLKQEVDALINKTGLLSK